MVGLIEFLGSIPADSWVSAIREVLLLAVTAWGVSVAARGLNTWKEQLKGSAEWELARRLLRAVYRLRDALDDVRNPFMSAGELAGARATLGSDEAGKNEAENLNDSTIAAYQVRWESARKAVAELQVELVEAEVLWGQEAKASMEPLRHCWVNLFSHLQFHLRGLSGRPPSAALADKVDKTVFASLGEDDVYAAELRAAVEKAENLIRPKLRR